MFPLPNVPEELKAQPPIPMIVNYAGIYIRSTLLKEAGLVIGQHSHAHDHATFVGSGRARGWKNGEWIGDKGPGEAFEVEAGAEHTYQALEADTLLACAHNEESAMSIDNRSIGHAI